MRIRTDIRRLCFKHEFPGTPPCSRTEFIEKIAFKLSCSNFVFGIIQRGEETQLTTGLQFLLQSVTFSYDPVGMWGLVADSTHSLSWGLVADSTHPLSWRLIADSTNPLSSHTNYAERPRSL
jgi:hypothetical protein